MSSIDNLAKDLVKIMHKTDEKGPKPYEPIATVVKEDENNGDILWVKIPGSDSDTPVEKTINANPGDSVRVRVSGGRAWVVGNASNPPTDDTRANQVGAAAQPSIDFVAALADKDVTVKSITAATGYIDDLYSKNITTENLKAAHAYIDDLETKNITTENIEAATGYIGDLTSKHITVDDLEADHATINTLDANYANIHLANVDVAWIEQGNIKKAEVFDENVFDLSGNRATLSRIDASKINVANLRADNLVVRRINGQPVVGGYTLISNTSPGYESKNPQALGWYEFVNAQWVLSTDTTVDMTKAYYQEGNEVSLYDQAYIDGLENDLQQQIDGAVQTYTGAVVPTLTNWPYTDWYDTSVTPIHDERAKHVGDIYYVVNSSSDEGGYCYRFAYDNTEHAYSWVLIKDSDVTKALSDISELQTFESETTSWIDETDEGLETIRTNHTALSGRVDDVEATANAALPATTFETFESTTFTDLVDEVDEQSTTMTNMTTRLGLNADGTQSATDIVSKESALEQTVNGISTRVGKTEMHLAGMYATSSTAAGTAAKVATIVPTLANYELANGAMVTVKFVNDNTTSSPTLNLNSTGAKPIKTYSGGNLTEAEYKWKAGSTFTFTYNGTNWLMQDSTASVRMSTNETQINQTADSIESLASNNSTYTKPDGSTGTNAMASAISQNASNISLKVSKNDVINQINVSTEGAQISASKVDIAGAAIFNNYSTTTQMNSAIGTAVDGIEVGGRNLVLKTGTMPTSGTGRFRASGTGAVVSHVDVSGTFTSGITGGIRVTNNETSASRVGFAQDNRTNTFIAGHKYTMSCWIRTSASMTTTVTLQPIWISAGCATKDIANVSLSTDWKWISIEGLVLSGSQQSSYSCGYVYVHNVPANGWFEVCGIKVEEGNKATDWTPAPEDVQAEIDVKKSVHTLMSASAGNTYANILTWTAEGYSNSWWIDNAKTPLTDIKVGDTCRVAYKVTDMNNAYVYVVGEMTSISGSTLTMTMHGLDTTIIDGGNILTNSIGANKIKTNEITIGSISGGADAANNASTALSKVNYYNRACQVGNYSNTQTNLWRKFASYTETGTYQDAYIIFDVSNNGDFGANKKFGRLKAHLRTEGTVGGVSNIKLEWLTRGEGISLSDFVLAYKATSGTDVKVELWVHCPSSYSGYRFGMVEEGKRASIRTTELWTLHDDWSANGSSITSGYTQVVSTDIDNARTTATSYITHIDDTGITIHPSGTTNNRVEITASGMDVYKGATNVGYFHGDSMRIGQAGNARVDIATSGVDMYGYNASASTPNQNLCHIGFASGNAQSGTTYAPFYTFGTRSGNIGNYSFVAGVGCTASGAGSHAEGLSTQATVTSSHAEGWGAHATGISSHAEGDTTIAKGNGSHAEGYKSEANGNYSHASGYYSIANGNYQTVIGQNNVADTSSLFIVGNGSASRSTIFKIDSSNITIKNGAGLRFNDGAGSEYSWNQIYSGTYSGTSNLYITADGYVAFYVGNASTAPTGRMYVNYEGTSISGYLSVGDYIRLGNTKWLYGKNSSGADRGLCCINSTNDYFFGYGSYNANEGNVYFDGNTVNIRSKGNVNITGPIYPSTNIKMKNNTSIQGATTGNAYKALIFMDDSNRVHIGNSDSAVYVAGTSFTGNKPYSGSDLRLKHDIVQLDDRSEKLIMSLKPFEFEWKKDQELFCADGKCFGLGAQDVEDAMRDAGYDPEVYKITNEMSEGYLTLCYTEFIPHLIHVVQKQQREIDELKGVIKCIS